jgi:iron complex transport system ATP-binding protein
MAAHPPPESRMTVPLVSAQNLSAAAGSATLVRNLSLTAEAGQVVSIVGPNGAGKSTLLEILAGERLPDSGTVILDGQNAAATSPLDLARLRCFLGQHAAPEVPFTVREVVAMGRYAHRGVPDSSSEHDASAITTAMAATDVSHLADRVVASLSGGEEQRVHVARILAQETPIAFLDEPTNALDISHQELVMRSLRSAAAGGGAVVVVLHDLNLAALFSDKLVLMSGGEAVATGTPRTVLTADIVSNVYGHPVSVIDHPFRDAPLVLPTGDN